MEQKRSGFKILAIALFLILVFVNPIFAQTEEEAIQELVDARKGMQQAISLGFTVTRINDTMMIAEQLFEAQQTFKKTTGQSNYILIMEQLKEVNNLLTIQIEMNDELMALQKVLQDESEESKAHELFNEAKQEFEAERFENIPKPIDRAYEVMNEERAIETKVRTFYLASTRNIIDAIKSRWREVLAGLSILVVLYLFLNKKIRIMLINRKMRNVKLEISVLQDLMKKTQEEYFHLFNIPEDLYFIKVKKFGEFIRRLNTKLPILAERKAALQGKKLTGEKIPLKTRIKKKLSFLSRSRKKIPDKEKEMNIKVPEAPKAEEPKEEAKDEMLLPKVKGPSLLKNMFSYKKFRATMREKRKTKEERKKQKLLKKKIDKESKLRQKEQGKRMKKIIKLKKEREKEFFKQQKKERFVMFKSGFMDKIRSIFKPKLRIKVRKDKAKILRKMRVKSRQRIKKMDTKTKKKEDEYFWLLLKERNKPRTDNKPEEK